MSIPADVRRERVGIGIVAMARLLGVTVRQVRMIESACVKGEGRPYDRVYDALDAVHAAVMAVRAREG